MAARAAACRQARPAPAIHSAAVADTNRSGINTPGRPTPGENDPGVLSIAWPILVPSELRHCFRSACRQAAIDIKVQDGKCQRQTPFYFALDATTRQRRRKTWTWRRERNQLPNDAQVDVVVHGARPLEKFFAATAPVLAAAQRSVTNGQCMDADPVGCTAGPLLHRQPEGMPYQSWLECSKGSALFAAIVGMVARARHGEACGN
jgi:hypothetical protein